MTTTDCTTCADAACVMRGKLDAEALCPSKPTPPAPTADEVREARKYLTDFRHSLLTTVGPEFTARIDILLAALDQAQGRVQELLEALLEIALTADPAMYDEGSHEIPLGDCQKVAQAALAEQPRVAQIPKWRRDRRVRELLEMPLVGEEAGGYAGTTANCIITDELEEAVESLQRMIDMDTFIEDTAIKMRTLLRHARAPRLTGEQRDYLRCQLTEVAK